MSSLNRLFKGKKDWLFLLALLPFFVFLIFNLTTGVLAQSGGQQLFGYAWSSNIGWTQLHGGGANVVVEQDGNITGYAWNAHLGWLDFNPNIPYPAEGPDNSVRMEGNSITGWARFCSVFAEGCSGDLKPDSVRGGWDGWIRMENVALGVTQTSTSGHSYQEIEGYAWGSDEFVGWIDLAPEIETDTEPCTPEYVGPPVICGVEEPEFEVSCSGPLSDVVLPDNPEGVFEAQIDGGVPNYDYTWYYRTQIEGVWTPYTQVGDSIESSNSQISNSVSFDSPGIYQIRVGVIDGNSDSSFGTCPQFDVTGDPSQDALAVSCDFVGETFTIGQDIDVIATSTRGDSSSEFAYRKFNWLPGEGGSNSSSVSARGSGPEYITTNNISVLYQNIGTYTVYVQALNWSASDPSSGYSSSAGAITSCQIEITEAEREPLSLATCSGPSSLTLPQSGPVSGAYSVTTVPTDADGNNYNYSWYTQIGTFPLVPQTGTGRINSISFDTTGTYQVIIEVEDEENDIMEEAVCNVVVNAYEDPDPDPEDLSIQCNVPDEVIINEPVTITAPTSGGSSPYSYNWTVTDPEGCGHIIDNQNGFLDITFDCVDSYGVAVVVTDGEGEEATAICSSDPEDDDGPVIVDPDEPIVDIESAVVFFDTTSYHDIDCGGEDDGINCIKSSGLQFITANTSGSLYKYEVLVDDLDYLNITFQKISFTLSGWTLDPLPDGAQWSADSSPKTQGQHTFRIMGDRLDLSEVVNNMINVLVTIDYGRGDETAQQFQAILYQDDFAGEED